MRLTVEDMAGMFGEDELLQIAGSGPRDMRVLDRGRIEEAIAHCHHVAVGYVRERWPTAVDGTPMLNGLIADMARLRLRSRGGQSSAMNETVEQRAADAVARLRDIQAGRLALDIMEPALAEATQAQRVLSAGPPDRLAQLLAGFR